MDKDNYVCVFSDKPIKFTLPENGYNCTPGKQFSTLSRIVRHF